MLRIHTGRSAEGAKAYFDKGLSREDYYAEGREVVGTWHGLGSKLLGLEGEVDREAFHGLCDNKDPRTGDRLTPRNRANRRVGFDISFSVPKSVSIQQTLTENREILEAFQSSVRETMTEMEHDAETRVRKSGSNHNRNTGNLIWGEFVHYTARPVKGRSDPHLHAHCWTFNSTFDPVEKRWKALDLEAIWKKAPYYQAAFDSRFAEKLQKLGFEIEQKEKGWELKGYSRELIETFSRRTKLIEALAETRGITSDRERDGLGARTREAKNENEDKAAQRREWAARLSPAERLMVDQAEADRSRRPAQVQRSRERKSAEQCLDFAIRHSFERQSVVRETSLLADALNFSVGSIGVEAVKEELEKRKATGRILAAEINNSAQLTTPEILQEERRMTAWARDGRGTLRALGSDSDARNVGLRALLSGGKHPDSHQIAAVEHVLGSQDRVILIRGKAGTGKTTMMRAAGEGIRAGGKEVHFFAPGAEASRGVLASEGFTDATTVAKLLQDKELQRRLHGQVIWVDEAGTLGAKDMNRLFEVAEDAKARVILSGDVTQHAPVARGDALRVLETEAGLRPAELTTIYRQTQTAYREAVEAISKGDAKGIAAGFGKLDEMGAIREVASEERYRHLAGAYLETVLESKKTALVVSPTHREGEKVTAAIREGLREAGELGSESRSLVRLRSLGLTEAERSDARNYQPGQVVQIHGRLAKLHRGEKYEVVEARQDRVWLAQTGDGPRAGNRISLPLDQSEKFDVFRRDAVELSKGDRIRITRNGMARSRTPAGRMQELRNGAIYEIDDFSESGDIEALHRDANGKITSRVLVGCEFGNLTHGYCVTSHASQGKTVDRVFIAQSSESFRASTREQFYVSISRGRESVAVFTDDKEALKWRVMESAARVSATEFARSADAEHAFSMERHTRSSQRLLGEARDYARERSAQIIKRFTAVPKAQGELDGRQRQL